MVMDSQDNFQITTSDPSNTINLPNIVRYGAGVLKTFRFFKYVFVYSSHAVLNDGTIKRNFIQYECITGTISKK